MSAIKHNDGQYALHCWLSAENEGECDSTDYAESIAPLKARAAIILKGGRYEYLEINRWNATENDWDNLEVIERE